MTDSLDIPGIKRLIWKEVGGSWDNHVPINGNRQYLVNAQTNINWDHNQDTHSLYEYEKLLKEIKRLRSTKPTTTRTYSLAPVPRPNTIDHDYKARYTAAHKLNFEREYPEAFKDGHYSAPLHPKIGTSNGLMAYIVNFINWHGFRSTRINVQGRLIDKKEKQLSGAVISVEKMIKSSTRKGTADVSSTINGKSIQWEIKIGRDRPSEAQINEQRKERRAGGEYFFIYSVHEFLTRFDEVLYG